MNFLEIFLISFVMDIKKELTSSYKEVHKDTQINYLFIYLLIVLCRPIKPISLKTLEPRARPQPTPLTNLGSAYDGVEFS